MPDLTNLVSESAALAIQMLILILLLVIILMSLRIVWRAEKQLDVFFKLLTFGFFFLFIMQLIPVLIASELITDSKIIDLIRIVPVIFFISALLKMNALIKKLDKEK